MMMNNMKMMNENELDLVNGGIITQNPNHILHNGEPNSALHEFLSTEILNDEMVEAAYNTVCDGFSVVKYVLFG